MGKRLLLCIIVLIMVCLSSLPAIAGPQVSIAVIPVDHTRDSEVGRFLIGLLRREMLDDHSRKDLGIMGPMIRQIKNGLKKSGYSVVDDYFEEEKNLKDVIGKNKKVTPAQYAVFCKVAVTERNQYKVAENPWETDSRSSSFKVFAELADLTTGRVLSSIIPTSSNSNFSSSSEAAEWFGSGIAEQANQLLQKEQWKAELLQGQDGKLYITSGKRQGLFKKQVLVLGNQNNIIDPSNGQIIHSYIIDTGKVEVETVEDNYTVCKLVEGELGRSKMVVKRSF